MAIEPLPKGFERVPALVEKKGPKIFDALMERPNFKASEALQKVFIPKDISAHQTNLKYSTIFFPFTGKTSGKRRPLPEKIWD